MGSRHQSLLLSWTEQAGLYDDSALRLAVEFISNFAGKEIVRKAGNADSMRSNKPDTPRLRAVTAKALLPSRQSNLMVLRNEEATLLFDGNAPHMLHIRRIVALGRKVRYEALTG